MPPRLVPTRMPERATTSDRAALDALLADVAIGHVALVVDDHPAILPTAIARDGDRIIAHGSTGSRWMRALAAGASASVAVTSVEGIVVARSAFESSYHYRSAVLFGRFTPLEGDEKAAAAAVLADQLIPGRVAEIRASTKRELAATLILAMPIDEWSLKASHGEPDDPAEDVEGPAWAGVVPMRTVYGPAQPASDLLPGREVPASVQRLISSCSG